MRALISIDPQAFVELVFPGAQFIQLHPTKIKGTELDADAVIEVDFCNERLIIHIEFQTYNDKTMAQRLARYNVLLCWQHSLRLPVLSYVIYLLQDGNIAPAPLLFTAPGRLPGQREEILRFNYGNIEIGKMLPQDIIGRGRAALLAFLPLTQGGATRAVVEQMLVLLTGWQYQEIALIGFLLATLAFYHSNLAELSWLEKRFSLMRDILRDTPGYQWMVHQEREASFAEGQIQGQIKTLRQVVLDLVQEQFPSLTKLAEQQVAGCNDQTRLRYLILKISATQQLEQVKLLLLNAQ